MRKRSLHVELTTNPLLRIAAPLLVFVVVLGTGLFQISRASTVYKASARIWVQKSLFGGGGRGAQPGEIPESPLMEGATNLTTFCEVVQSDAVLRLAYEELKEKLPADKLPERSALTGIKAQPAKDANIISIEFTSPDQEVSTLVVQSVIDALMRENSMQIKGPLEETRERLDKQLEIARKEYADSKENLKQFQNSVGSIDFQTEATGLSTVRSEMQQQIDEAGNEIKALHTKKDFLEKQLGFGAQDVLSVEKISNDEVINHLKQTIAQAEVKLIELKSKFQDEHPRVQRLKAVLADAKAEMAARYTTLLGKVDPKFEGISHDSEVQRELLTEMVQASTDLVAGESKVQSLNESLDALNSKIAMLPAKQKEFADLQRQDELATNTLAAVESELQRVKLTESVSLSSSRLQVIDSSKVAMSSCALNLPILILVGLVVAGMTAVIQNLLDPRVLRLGYLRSFPLRIVGWYPSITNGVPQSIPYSDRLRLSIKHWLIANKVIWITSPSAGDGKTLVARSLAESFVEAGYKVVLIDANLVHPDLHMELEVPASPGLLQHLAATEALSVNSLLCEIRPNFFFVPAGGVSDNLRLLSSLRFERFIQALYERFDVLIVDGGASDESNGALQISENKPNLLVVVRMKHTFKKTLEMLKSQIRMLPISESGMIVNESKASAIDKLVSEPMQAPIIREAVATGSSASDTSDAPASW